MRRKFSKEFNWKPSNYRTLCGEISRKRSNFFEWTGLLNTKRRRKRLSHRPNDTEHSRHIDVNGIYSLISIEVVNVFTQADYIVTNLSAIQNVELLRFQERQLSVLRKLLQAHGFPLSQPIAVHLSRWKSVQPLELPWTVLGAFLRFPVLNQMLLEP